MVTHVTSRNHTTPTGGRFSSRLFGASLPLWARTRDKASHDPMPLQKTMKASTLQSMFQQDGATCHTARATIDLLKDTFDDRLISRFGPVNWLPRSCDLTPLDYFLWGYVKSLVYADKPQTLDHLEDNIRRVIANIRPQMLEKVIEN
ncbi:transposable element Tc3 transposase [Trichonephila clavipes]|uniref:Transposable element Tc3 transposase n=1 Tax=Trichonephila clavipes TaxID=2585209 RepID=A0A8X6W3G2_TRICX|nr:transposable element Tc3 transposase [Trichonephila clavipes]